VILALLGSLGCGPTQRPAVGEVVGRTYTAQQLGAAVTFGEGWQLALAPEHFRAGLEGTLLEARHGDLVAVLTFHALPDLGMLEETSALDLLPVLHPIVESGDDYRFERIPRCGGAVERQAGDWTHVGVRTTTGLIEWQAFGGDIEPLRRLACDDTRLL
jgi:hypothetical protein